MKKEVLKKEVRIAAEDLLLEKGYISPVDLLIKTGRLSKENYEAWRLGKIPYLEKVCLGNLSKLSLIMQELRIYSKENKLRSSYTAYKKWRKGKKTMLRFSKSGNSNIEKAYSTHYLKPKVKEESEVK